MNVSGRVGARDKLLATCLAVLSVGNLLVPNAENVPVVTYYLPGGLALIASIILLCADRVVRSDALPVVVLWVLTFVPGFLVTLDNEYTQYKLFGVLIAFVLLVGPMAFDVAPDSLRIYVRWVLWASLVGALMILVLGSEVSRNRYAFWDLNPIALGRASGLAVVICLAVLLFSRVLGLRTRLMHLAAILAGTVAIIATGSRGPLVAVVATAVALVVVAAATGRLRPGTALLLGGAGTGVVGFVLSFDLRGLNRFLEDQSSSGRSQLLKDTWNVFVDHPMGIGWGRLPDYVQFAGAQQDGRLYAHNIFLEVATEGGLVALIGFSILVVVCLRGALIAKAAFPVVSVVVLALMIYLLVSAQFSSDIVGNRALWAVMGAALALRTAARAEAERQPARSKALA